MNITDIEKMTEREAQQIALDEINIKDYKVYFVDFDGYFGFSALVYKNNYYIYYANMYELHYKHMHKTKSELKEMYINSLNKKLFFEWEIKKPLKDYDDLQAKQYFLMNLYPMQAEHYSIFGNFSDKKYAAEYKEKIKGMTYNPVALAYFPDKDFSEHLLVLWDCLTARRHQREEDFEYNKSAFLYEMFNHEYGINWQADYDTLSAFGNINWHDDDLNAYFDELHFTDTQKKAYFAARKEYYKKAEL